MNWCLEIADGLYNEGLFYEDDVCLGSVRFNNLKDFLQFLSILPNNRIKIRNPCILIKKGVPVELNKRGTVSKTNTIRKLSAEGHSPKSISELTGMSEKVVWEIHSRLKRHGELI